MTLGCRLLYTDPTLVNDSTSRYVAQAHMSKSHFIRINEEQDLVSKSSATTNNPDSQSETSSANIVNQPRLTPSYVIGSHLSRFAAAGDNLTGLAQSLGPVVHCHDCER